MDLTVLLITKGRNLYTIRWLYYANEIKLPYDIYIADGQPNKKINQILENKNNFPHINYKHVLYNDSSYKMYYKKIVHSIENINTKYVMLSDNDDFLMPKGINKSIDFLNLNKDYIGASGRIGFFQMSNEKIKSEKNLLGTPNFAFYNEGGYNPRSINKKSILERIQMASELYNVTWYSVFRRDKFKNITKENLENNFNSLNTSEFFFHLKALSLGSIHFENNYSSYMRQIGTSSNDTSSENTISNIKNGKLIRDFYNLTYTILENKNIPKKDKAFIKEEISICLGKHYYSINNKNLAHQMMLNNKTRIFFRSILKFIYPNYRYTLSKYRRLKEFKKINIKVENNHDLINIEKILNSDLLFEFIQSIDNTN